MPSTRPASCSPGSRCDGATADCATDAGGRSPPPPSHRSTVGAPPGRTGPAGRDRRRNARHLPACLIRRGDLAALRGRLVADRGPLRATAGPEHRSYAGSSRTEARSAPPRWRRSTFTRRSLAAVARAVPKHRACRDHPRAPVSRPRRRTVRRRAGRSPRATSWPVAGERSGRHPPRTPRPRSTEVVCDRWVCGERQRHDLCGSSDPTREPKLTAATASPRTP